MKLATKHIYQVILTYNVEESDATKALDKVLAAHPLKPEAFTCEPLELEDDDD